MSSSAQPASFVQPRNSVGLRFTASILSAMLVALGVSIAPATAEVSHLVISEMVTGGTSANDELIEIYNPAAVALPLEGLELVYASATGATVTRRAAWEAGAPSVPPGAHVLVANQLGVYAGIADAAYTSGIAATGGSVALRIQGAAGAIDAVGWGTAVGSSLEGTAAPAPPAGSSLERLPGGLAGSTRDSDDNAHDFAVRSVPDPQNAGSPPVPDPTQPSPTPLVDPTPGPPSSVTPTPVMTPSATGEPSPTPPASVPIATARSLPEGATVTVEGTALTASDFSDGGGYLVDASGGIAVLCEVDSFARGERLTVTGALDDRFAQRTIRVASGGVVHSGSGTEPTPINLATGAVNESVEAALVRVSGSLSNGSPLTDGVAYDLDDGSGSVRLVVSNATAIDTSTWESGRRVAVVGVVGQRDSSGSGVTGYRVQPRSAADVAILPDATPTPAPTSSGSASPDPSATPLPGGVVSVAQARAAARNARVTVRGTVTLASGVIDAASAVIQDSTGAILLRLSADAGRLNRGRLVEVHGLRSTKGGMETLRVGVRPRQLGAGSVPPPAALRTGDAGEASEAELIVVRGALVASARRASSRAVSFDLDDGSGPLRVAAAATLRLDSGRLKAGTWVEVRGVLGQQTTAAEPASGYRVWPRVAADVRVAAPATAVAGGGEDAPTAGGSSAGLATLDALGASGGADVRVGATLVIAEWPELGVAGLLWDGQSVAAIDPRSTDDLAPIIGDRRAPLALELAGMREVGTHPLFDIAMTEVGPQGARVIPARLEPPAVRMPGIDDPARWVAMIGTISTGRAGRALAVGDGSVAIELACDEGGRLPAGVVSVAGLAPPGAERMVVPCGGISAAPGLALSLLNADAEAARPTGGGVGAVPTAADGTRAFAAALLVAAAALVVAAVAARQRLGRQPDAGATAVEAADPVLDVDDASPRLTLVAVPRERGP